MATTQKLPDLETAAREEAMALEARYGHLEPDMLIGLCVEQFFPDQIAAVSSFGNGSAVLLHMIAKIDRTLPVIFLDTGKHFDETLAYRDELVDELGLTDVSVIEPRPEALARNDPGGQLHRADPDRCCAIRKVEPMARALAPWRAWFTGRKRYQAATRSQLRVFEAVGPRVRINPLAAWRRREMLEYAARHGLPTHPLVAYGYYSVGCLPCTQPASPGEDERSGRWAGQAKTECGIHLPVLDRSISSSPL